MLLPVDVDEPVWLAARRNGVGGSDAAAVCGFSRFRTPLAVYLSKVHADDRDGTDQMRWGKLQEPVLRAWFEQQHGIAVRRCGLLASRDRPWQLATPDGLTADGGIVEYKTTRYAGDEWDDDQVPDDAEVQVQHTLAVTGRSHAWVAVSIGGAPPIFRRVERDDALIADLTEIERVFWHEHVVPRVPPPLQPPDVDRMRALPADGAVIDEPSPALLAAIDEYRAACDRYTDAENAKDLAAAVLLDELGGAEEVWRTDDGVRRRLLTCRASSFRPKDFAEAHPELAEKYSRQPPPVVSGPALRVADAQLWRSFCSRVIRLSKSKKVS